jgi:co-chaperonin GroES (HSP10)
MNNGGDVLARGGSSAQFAAGGSELSDFEYDLRTRTDIVSEKYGLSQAEIEEYTLRVNAGERIDLKSVALAEELGAGIEVIDRRRSFASEVETAKVTPVAPKKFADKKFSAFTPILDRILVKRCAEGPDMKIMEDGSVLNTKTGLVIAAKYRQHSNIGIVLATGQFVILGGQRIAMSEVVRVGDRVTYGDYNSEVFLMDEPKVQELCDSVQMNYEPDAEGLRIVRVQDVRGVETPIIVDAELEQFRKEYTWVDRLSDDQKKLQRQNPVLEEFMKTGEVKIADIKVSGKDTNNV